MKQACGDSNRITISGNLSDVPDGTKVTLVLGATHMEEEPVAEATVSDGRFDFELDIDEPRQY